MATKLEKDVIRESNIIVNGKVVDVALTATQEVSMSVKGKGGATVSITLQDLWDKLYGTDDGETTSKTDESRDDSPVVNLYDLRSRFCTSLEPDMIHKVDAIMADFVEEHRDTIRKAELKKIEVNRKNKKNKNYG